MSEILGVLFKYLLALLAITAVVVVLYEALSSNKTSTAVSDITTLQANVNQLYAGTAPTDIASNDITTTIAGSNVAPSDMISSSTALQNPWGGAGSVTVQTVAPTSSAGPQATIQLSSVPNDACAKMVGTLMPSMVSISVNGTVGTQGTSGAAATAEAACTQASTTPAKGSAAPNLIIFTFNLS